MKERNNTVDLLRGVAMMLVVLGHTLTGCIAGAEDTLLFNFIWSVQMPLFFMISGYVTKYSRQVEGYRELGARLVKLTRAYLLPWGVWTFLIRGLLLGEKAYFNLRYLLWHMDAGYWYLTSLWTIAIIFTIVPFLVASLHEEKFKYCVFLGIGYGFGMILLLMVGLLAGLSFWNIKLTLYYMLFYFLGVFLGVWDSTGIWRNCIQWKKSIITISCMLYIWILVRINLYYLLDDIVGIVLRILAGILGCFLLWQMSQCFLKGTLAVATAWIGKNSMGIYVSHYIFLHFLFRNGVYTINSIAGMIWVSGSFLIIMLLSVLTCLLLDKNPVIRRLCLGK